MNAVYRQLKTTIDKEYPKGWFVAIEEDQVISATADFHDLERTLRALGKDPRNVLVVEAGVEIPQRVTIFV
jgi:hypothetical protein